MTDETPCDECGTDTDPYFYRESGGLCGECLASYAFLPLTVFGAPDDSG